MIKIYRKKPVTVEAVQLSWKTWCEVCDFVREVKGRYSDTYSDTCYEGGPPWIEMVIPTLEGEMIARHGDYIIKGVNGEFYPCKPDIFEKTYELDE